TITGPLAVSANFATGSNWYSGAWTRRKPITIDHTKVSGSSSLSGFPVLISYTDTNLKTAAKADGTDILFTAGDGVTKLNHELELYDGGTGQIAAWVNVPSVSPSADTVIYMYYANASASDQSNKN